MRAVSDRIVAGVSIERLRRLDAMLHRYVDVGKLPGGPTVVSRHGQIVHRACYGHTDVETGQPVVPDTLYRIYSMTKPVATVALLALHQEGHRLLPPPGP